MSLLPSTGEGLDLASFQMPVQPGRTYALQLERQRVQGMTDGRAAVAQAIYLILHTERYAYPIYSRNYGAELSDLLGRPLIYAMSESKRRITEALLQDDRITGLDDWTFEPGLGRLYVRFNVHTIYGSVPAEREVAL